jgi:ribosomal protein S18 acetylase RimI-like enzyme
MASKQQPLEETIWLLDGDGDDLRGWVALDPPDGADMAVRVDLRGGAVEAGLIDWTVDKLRSAGDIQTVRLYAWGDETERRALLGARGFTAEARYYRMGQTLETTLPEPRLPEGFRFLPIMRPEDAPARADVHAGAFHPSRMTPALYRHFMTAPGYDPALDTVVVAPDGRFAAFVMGWIDPQSGVSNFEPVGTRPEFQRRGLGRACLIEALRRVQARGMIRAHVSMRVEDSSNREFYEAAGFRQINTDYGYTRTYA